MIKNLLGLKNLIFTFVSMKKLILIFLGALLSTGMFAQDKKGLDFTDGWVLTKKGDTLRGKVCYENTKTGERFEKIKFIDAKDATQQKKSYGVEKLTSFGTKGLVFEFIVLDVEIPPMIMERVVTGDLNLYRCWFKTQLSTPQKMDYVVGMFLKKKDSTELYEVLDKKFQKEMSAYFKGDEDIVKLIKEKNYTVKDIDKIVIAYNEKE
jgi:hypothetical protein